MTKVNKIGRSGNNRNMKWWMLAAVIVALMVATVEVGAADNYMDVPLYGQHWEPWSSEKIGHSETSFHECGCAITSIAMVMSYYEKDSFSDLSTIPEYIDTNSPIWRYVTPYDVNVWLTNHNGLSYDLVNWRGITEDMPGGRKVEYEYEYGYSYYNYPLGVPADLDILNDWIDTGYPVIVNVTLTGHSHFIVITGRSGNTYFINDPWYGDRSTLTPRYGQDPAMAIRGFRGVFRGDIRIPLSGDWDGDGIDTHGIYDPVTKNFVHDGMTENPNLDLGVTPLAGDWDGDGIDTIGGYNPVTSTFILDRNGDDVIEEQERIPFGIRGDTPITGDWNGDGIGQIAVYRSDITTQQVGQLETHEIPYNDNGLGTSEFYLDLNNDGSSDSHDSPYNPLNWAMYRDIPIIGDWNGNCDGSRSETVGIFRNKELITGGVYRYAIFYPYPSELGSYPFGNKNDIPIVGKWDISGYTKAGIYRYSVDGNEFQFIPDSNPMTSCEGGRSGGPDSFGYTFKDSNTLDGPSYDWIEFSGTGTPVLTSSDDSWVENINIGFFFNYYGTDYSQLAISNNGLLFSGVGTWQYVNQPITQTPGVHGFVAPYWDDIVT